MDLSAINPILLLASLMVAATPILLAAVGELVVERAGVLNLGVEGMMITGAVCGFIIAVATGSPWLGFIGAAVGGAMLSLLFGLLTQFLLSNQVATGLALTLFGLGLSALMGQGYLGIRAPAFPDWHIPFLGDIPVIGPIVFQHDPMVYVGLLIVAGVWFFLNRTRAGLILRAVGENHDAAHALGYHVRRTRMLAIMFGGACAGLGGAYLSLVRVPQWTEGMTAGAGWIALAIVVFASWKPVRLVLGAYLFGGVTVLQLNLQAAGAVFPLEIIPNTMLVGVILVILLQVLNLRRQNINYWKLLMFSILCAIISIALHGITVPFKVEYLSMSPYLATIAVLVIMSAVRAPGSLGRIFHAAR
jgi:ABC-type uncharacterized transport system permease subunit